MPDFDSLIFDLDGTLWDTTPSCVVAWNNCIEKLGIPYRPIVDEDLRRVTGKAHDDCIRLTFADLEESQVAALIKLTEVEDTAVIDKLGGTLYPGVAEGLKELSNRYRLFIVSNCQSGYIETFLDFSGFHLLFEDYECFGNTRQTKGHNLRQIIDRNGLSNPVMIGDASGDEVAARECGIPYFFVDYGFGEATAPDESFSSFSQLADHLLKLK